MTYYGKDNAHYRRIKYPTDFVFRWCSRRHFVERRGQRVREISFDQQGNALYEFEDGTRVVSSQNSVRWWDKETREQVLGKRHLTWAQIHKKPFISKFKREKAKAVKERMIAVAEEAGAVVKTKLPSFFLKHIPFEVKEAVVLASQKKSMTQTSWIMEAIMEKLDREIVQPFTEDKMAVKTIKPIGQA